ncbi:hypothetical protein M8C21_029959 [Ambrosia artemisiifolia]|uniref:Glycosyltransferase n=1 Tax=Ambrosia artemisiifolia TaxID=4212 RepID=A0AAD5GED0_AMBAR|nr:hypothetical protein M8C21_029959 [Ambrosia artemisiifolia]
MLNSELVFIPSPGAGHLPPTVELAKLLLDRDQRLTVTIIIMNFALGPEHNAETRLSTPRLRYVDIPCDESTMALISPKTFLSAFVEHNKPRVRDIVRGITDSDSVRLAGFVVDMFCVAMIDVANEFGVPTYTYFTSGAATLDLMFYLQAKRDEEGDDVIELKNSESESVLHVPGFVNPVPAKVLPEVALDKEGGSSMFLNITKRFRESKAIIVNTFQDLETHPLEYLLSSSNDIPPVFAVGPILNLENKKTDDHKSDEILSWLNEQPKSSVVFLCFGSMGSFNEKQVKEIAVALERSGHRFLWSLRRPVPKDKFDFPKEYENFEEVLQEGFLSRTSSVGKVIGWAPQMAVLSHPSVGGFVSHCGWNSTLESIWCGVPVAAWPLSVATESGSRLEMVVEVGSGNLRSRVLLSKPIVETEPTTAATETADVTTMENPPVKTVVKETKASAPRKPKNPAAHPPYLEVFRLHFVCCF